MAKSQNYLSPTIQIDTQSLLFNFQNLYTLELDNTIGHSLENKRQDHRAANPITRNQMPKYFEKGSFLNALLFIFATVVTGYLAFRFIENKVIAVSLVGGQIIAGLLIFSDLPNLLKKISRRSHDKKVARSKSKTRQEKKHEQKALKKLRKLNPLDFKDDESYNQALNRLIPRKLLRNERIKQEAEQIKLSGGKIRHDAQQIQAKKAQARKALADLEAAQTELKSRYSVLSKRLSAVEATIKNAGGQLAQLAAGYRQLLKQLEAAEKRHLASNLRRQLFRLLEQAAGILNGATQILEKRWDKIIKQHQAQSKRTEELEQKLNQNLQQVLSSARTDLDDLQARLLVVRKKQRAEVRRLLQEGRQRSTAIDFAAQPSMESAEQLMIESMPQAIRNLPLTRRVIARRLAQVEKQLTEQCIAALRQIDQNLYGDADRYLQDLDASLIPAVKTNPQVKSCYDVQAKKAVQIRQRLNSIFQAQLINLRRKHKSEEGLQAATLNLCEKYKSLPEAIALARQIKEQQQKKTSGLRRQPAKKQKRLKEDKDIEQIKDSLNGFRQILAEGGSIDDLTTLTELLDELKAEIKNSGLAADVDNDINRLEKDIQRQLHLLRKEGEKDDGFLTAEQNELLGGIPDKVARLFIPVFKAANSGRLETAKKLWQKSTVQWVALAPKMPDISRWQDRIREAMNMLAELGVTSGLKDRSEKTDKTSPDPTSPLRKKSPLFFNSQMLIDQAI